MPRLNRGKTNRVSIKLSAAAKTRIEAAAKNLGVSRASMIMYALSEQIEKGISINQLLRMESKITLEREHFAIVMPKHLNELVNGFTEEFEMKKNSLIGYLVSDYFENLPEDNRAFQERETVDSEGNKIKPKPLVIEIHKQLKERLYAYAEKHFFNVSFLVSEAIHNGRFKGIPDLPGSEREQISFTITKEVYEASLDQADKLGVPLHFFIESCIYNAFYGESKIFNLDKA